MFTRVRLIMWDTFLDVARHKMLVIHLVFVCIALGLFNIFGHFSTTPALEYRMIQDVGLSIISLFGLLIALFIGSTTLRDDIHRRTVYAVLTLPMRRWELYTGKFLGTLLAVIVNVLIMLGILTFLLFLKFNVVWTGFHWVALFMLFEFSVMSGMVLLFSLADSLLLCFSLSLFTVMLGNMTEHVLHLVEHAEIPLLSFFTTTLYWVIPNFGYFNIKHKILKDLAISGDFALWATGYACCYLFFLLVAGSWLFEKKDL
ncbi:MAG TPA: ABC transporter permease subunit [Candidatus Ozemobacteraceae bacterium]|nr:ABC transporter permease subunit [Candidatus Ozemobacteraceae bacterium]